MTDYVTIKRSDIEAAINKFEGTDGWAARLADEIRALLDKAPSVEPVCWAVDCKPEYADLYNFDERNVIVSDEITLRDYQEDDSWVITPLYTSPPQVAENPNPLTRIMLNYIKGEEEFDTTPLESDHIYVKHFKSLIQMRREEVKELQARIAELGKDARRYQWIKEQNADLENDSFVVLGHDCTIEEQWQKYWVGSDLDKAIDEAMEKTNG